eukprot:c25736_g1_i1.p1 GENE.c25736_g1_i1~~c25736_g1_i1.p1  ORF type:complete len:426 (-),score=69.44 c25736_g1_i1:64-1341(-)
MGGDRNSGIVAMERSRVGKHQAVTRTSRLDLIRKLLKHIVYMDAFPYRPQYEFRGSRSVVGAACTVLFLFAVILNLVSEIGAYNNSAPQIKTSLRPIDEYRDEHVVPFPRIGVMFRKAGGQDFYNDQYFKVQFQQGDAFHGQFPVFSDAGRKQCEFTEPNGRFTYSNLSCPISDLGLQGSEHLPRYRFVRVNIEQCINWTVWNNRDAYVPSIGSTSASGLCASQEKIDQVFREGIFTLFVEENEIRTDTVGTFDIAYFRKLSKVALSNLFLSQHYRLRLRKVSLAKRYVLDADKSQTNFMRIVRSDVTVGGLEETVLSCNSAQAGCDREPHLFRMAFIFSLDNSFIQDLRTPIPLYDLFMNFGGVTFFFFVVFGGLATYLNKFAFKNQTKGLDLRKLDNSQFDKFGNLVDKSFQMPREYQDMAAE